MLHRVKPPNPSEEGDSLILLTGAGSSAYLGMRTLESIVDPVSGVRVPLNARVSQTIQRTWEKVKVSNRRVATFEEVIGRLTQYQQCADLMAHDQIFQSALGSVPFSVGTGQFSQIWEEALIECYGIMKDFYGPGKINTDSKEFANTIEFLRVLASINENRLHVFTTNYDCSYNVVASKTEEMSFITHIENETTGHFRDTWYYARPDIENQSVPLVYLHRLHGCVAWFAEAGAPYGLREIYGAGNKLEIDNPRYLNQMKIKLVASEQIGMNPAFSLAFNEFYDELKSCKVLLVWGHSFQDLQVLRTIKNAIETRTTPLEILYLDPYLSEAVAIDHIRQTLAGDPLGVGIGIKPRNIRWVVGDGNEKMIAMTRSAIERSLT